MTQTVETEIKVGLPEPVIPIERRNARELPYQKFVSDYVQKNKPVVISDSVPQWSAIREWSPEFFADRFGAEVVKVTDGLDMPMAELMEKVVASTPEKPAPYLHRLIIHRDMPELLRWLTPENAYAYPGRYCSPLMLKRLRRL